MPTDENPIQRAPKPEMLEKAFAILRADDFVNDCIGEEDGSLRVAIAHQVALALEEARLNCGHDPCQKGIWDEGWMTGLREGREESAEALRASEAAVERAEEHARVGIHSLHLQLAALRERALNAEASVESLRKERDALRAATREAVRRIGEAEHAPECNRRTVRCDCGAEVCYCNLLGHTGCSATVRPPETFKCKAKNSACDPPQDCDWPTCGCDPYADKVIAALEESGAFSAARAEATKAERERCLSLLPTWHSLTMDACRDAIQFGAAIRAPRPPHDLLDDPPSSPTPPTSPSTTWRNWRKRPVVIQAAQWFPPGDARFNTELVSALGGGPVIADVWTAGGDARSHYYINAGANFYIETLESNRHTVSPGDFIVKGVKDEFYAVKPDIFAKTYDPVLSPEPTPPSEGPRPSGTIKSTASEQPDGKTR